MGFLNFIKEGLGSGRAKEPEPAEEIRTPFRYNPDKIPDEDGYYPIICPHCLEKFRIWEIEFRAGTGSTAGGSHSEGGLYGKSTVAGLEGMFKGSGSSEGSAVQSAPAGTDKSELTAFPREYDEKHITFLRKVGKLGPTASPEAENKILRMFDEKGDPTGEVERIRLMDENGGESGEWIYLEGKKANDPALYHKPIAVVMDKYKHNSYIRVCPKCHNEISNLMGLCPGYVLGVVGNTFCGKSVYITKLRDILENAGILAAGGGHRFTGTGPGYAAAIADELDKNARKGQALLDPTRIEYIEPLVLNCKRGTGPGRAKMVITLFDFPGEALQPGKEINDFFDHYSNVKMNVDGWMFLFDSANFRSVSTIIRQYHQELEEFLPDTQISADSYSGLSGHESDEQKRQENERKKQAVTMAPMAVLNSFVRNFLKGGQFNAPVCFVITKSDILQRIQGDIRDLYPECMVPNPDFLNVYRYSQVDEVDLDMINDNSEQIQTMLGEDGLNDFTALNAKEYTERDEYAWFAVSAMGTPVRTGKHAALAQPVRVEEPMAWLLYMLGVLPGRSNNNELWR